MWGLPVATALFMRASISHRRHPWRPILYFYRTTTETVSTLLSLAWDVYFRLVELLRCLLCLSVCSEWFLFWNFLLHSLIMFIGDEERRSVLGWRYLATTGHFLVVHWHELLTIFILKYPSWRCFLSTSEQNFFFSFLKFVLIVWCLLFLISCSSTCPTSSRPHSSTLLCFTACLSLSSCAYFSLEFLLFSSSEATRRC